MGVNYWRFICTFILILEKLVAILISRSYLRLLIPLMVIVVELLKVLSTMRYTLWWNWRVWIEASRADRLLDREVWTLLETRHSRVVRTHYKHTSVLQHMRRLVGKLRKFNRIVALSEAWVLNSSKRSLILLWVILYIDLPIVIVHRLFLSPVAITLIYWVVFNFDSAQVGKAYWLVF